ncbi:DEAD/DEAH box helicase [Candidatus Skiveiella danica]|uniref:DEAD/DEAH box helicase n=1 Tax=Candidatus Skiveiella danica TaxID=3386177 RepID=UPI001E18311F|nr:DEAD/DEAH box helicase [Betaproteobacteria bacterium]
MKNDPLPTSYFSSLLPELATRAARATVSRLGFSNPALRQYLSERFSVDLGEPGCFVGEPVFEATFGWESAGQTLESLSPSLLSPKLVDALDRPAGSMGANYRFPRNDMPYRHQLEAWELLARPQPQSVIVTSGTGSGKTECFMVPILDQLAREAETLRGPVEGVRALFLYPLNALIQSQQERLHAWTGPFEGDIRFCLYNGQTPEKPGPKHITSKTPNQVLDRQALRASPPPILVTNATMLEYMLVRSQDAPILQRSRGKLRWIVLDEAHSYIGSQAAELSLLLRRVLYGFGVDSSDVRFVATSATIGYPSGEAGQKLREFLAGLAGVEPGRVHVVSGQRSVPGLPAGNVAFTDASLDVLEAIAPHEEASRFDAVCANTIAKEIRSLFVPALRGSPARPLRAICEVIEGPRQHHAPNTKQAALRWLDLLTRSRQSQGKDTSPFLPLRLHAFHNVLAGLWACCDPGCTCRQGTQLDSPDWAFGAVYTEQRETCECGSPVYELRSCNDCNETYLWGRLVMDRNQNRWLLSQATEDQTDEFQLEATPEDPYVESELDAAVELASPLVDEIDSPLVLIANRHLKDTAEATVERGSLIFDGSSDKPLVRLRVREMSEGQLTCPECGGHHGKGRLMFRAARLGAPFLLMQVIPTLLEFCPDGEDPQSKPLRGRRMITFTDSRQGTARMAASLQRDAERNSLRSAVYHFLAGRADIGACPEYRDLLQEIIEYEADFEETKSPRIESRLAAKKLELAKFTLKPVSFEDLAVHLSTHEADIRRWALNHYRDISPEQFAGDTGALELSRLFLFREFSRRPKRANSLETLGLVSVQYPKLDNLAAVPSQVSAHLKVSLEEWRQILKLTLDFVVREMSCLEFKDTWKRWVGKKTVSARFLPPDSKDKPNGVFRRWPQTHKVGVQSRMVRLLAAAFHKDPATAEGRDIIDAVLRAVWDDLVRLGLLQKATDGRYLELTDLAFGLIGDAWMCPVTRRVLDVNLRGLTPYLPSHNRKASTIECQKVFVPKWPEVAADFTPPSLGIEAARRWLSTDLGVLSLRELGLWSNVNDRVVEGVRYYRTAEHSAQQPGSTLQDYEDQFKQGKINLLSCSTTMEMGVDIGGISVVAMNNVPPHPANYLQRAGRAGRRSETRSIALTVCKNNPHDQMVFGDPLWPFTTKLPAPAIKLESPVIVQRHLNAMLLADFLWKQIEKAGGQGDLNKLNMEWWALPKDSSLADAFMAKAECFDPQTDEALANGLRMLLKGTCFDGSVSLSTLAIEAAKMMKAMLDGWYGEYFAVKTQLSTFDEKKQQKEPAFRALSIQAKRLTDEYLLRELASGGFLPGYGFPTNVTSFEMLNKEALDKQRYGKDQGREDNKMRRRDLPSRDAVTALREYAPGADVVIDGQVYRSAGVTLNWHAPASIDIKQIQSIRQAWRCSHCGASGTEVTREGHEHCDACGELLHDDQRFTYLEPAGFAVDLYAPTHTDVSEQSFVPVSQPWINAEGPWLPLANQALGSFRSSSTGRVFNHSGGVNRNGYAICLECGRAEPMPLYADDKAKDGLGHLPAKFREPHKRLRGAQGGETAICKGSHNPFSIKPKLHLGLEEVTDVIELQLNGLDGLPIADKVAAYSIAVALRWAVAASLGVESGEIGCEVKPIRHPMREEGFVIVLYDHAAAGYCSSVADHLPELFQKARDQLDCHANCQGACQHCLMDYDNRFRRHELDRFTAIKFLSEEWMQRMQLQPGDEFFGSGNSHAETHTLAEAITREWAKGGATELRIFLQGDPRDWDFAAATFKRLLLRWSERGAVKLVLPLSAVEILSPEQLYALGQLSEVTNANVQAHIGGTRKVLAEVVTAGGCFVWGSRDEAIGLPGSTWGQAGSAVLVRGRIAEPETLGDALETKGQTPTETSPKAGRIEMRTELDGLAEAFGPKLLDKLAAGIHGPLLEGDGDIKTVIYRDRYLNAPLPVSLLVSFIGAIKGRHQSRWDNPLIEIVTAGLPTEGRTFPLPSQVFHNWLDTNLRDAAIKAAFSYRGMNAAVRNLPKPAAAHARTLEIGLADGHKLKVWLDQGFGYWSSPRPGTRAAQTATTWFNFKEDPSSQGEEISEGRYAVEGQSFATHVFFEKV